MKQSKLCVNLDHIATLRQARGEEFPSLLDGIKLAESAGADGITLHLREDRRHIQDADIYQAADIIHGSFTMEMAATIEMLDIAKQVQPDLLTIVPEKREELTTEGGLDIISRKDYLIDYLSETKNSGLRASLFIEPEAKVIEVAKELGADCVELHTGCFANAKTAEDINKEIKRIESAVVFGNEIGIQVNIGHGLSAENLPAISHIQGVQEYHIGFAIIARSVFVGLAAAIREVKEQIKF